MNIRKNHQMRMQAFDELIVLKGKNISRKEIVDTINSKFEIPIGTLYDWYKNKCYPVSKGTIEYKPELFYVIGALLGDGCIYYWKKLGRHLINLVGDRKFTTKFTNKVLLCTSRKCKAYENTKRNFWYVNICSIELYFLIKEIKENISRLEEILKQGDHTSNVLQFIEGFFDAEGCVKIIKERVRIVPKICLDITNTNLKYLELIRILLEKKLGILAKYSVQKGGMREDGYRRKTAYHLRIYKKEFVRIFFENIQTTKLTKEKIPYVEAWLNNGK